MTLTALPSSSSDAPRHEGLISSPCSVVETHDTSTTSGLIYELTDQDVLLGRGTGPNESQGNIRFRAMVRRVIQEMDPSKLNGKVKAKLAREILSAVKAENGRFLKTSSDGKSSVRCFSVIPDNIALDKIKQSFRHQLRVLEDADSKREMAATGGRDFVAYAASAGACPASSAFVAPQYHPQASMTPSLARLLNSSSTSGLTGTGASTFSLVRDQIEKEMMAEALASRALAASVAAARNRTTLRESALSNALMAADRCADSSPMAELVNALATAKAKAALRQVSALPYPVHHHFGGGLASLLHTSDGPSLGTVNPMRMTTGLDRSAGRPSLEPSNQYSDIESRLAAALAVVGAPNAHLQQQNQLSDTPRYLDMILRRGG
jgi:hypothetical protein